MLRRLVLLSLLGSAIVHAEPFVDNLDLGTLVSAVLNRHPDLAAMHAAWQAAQARIAQETSLDDPVLSYGFAPRTTGRPPG